jgi:hypothetical protein
MHRHLQVNRHFAWPRMRGQFRISGELRPSLNFCGILPWQRERIGCRLDFKPEHYEARQLVIALHGCMTRSLAGGRRAEATVLPTWVKPHHQIARPAARGSESLHEINSMSTGCLRGSIGAWSADRTGSNGLTNTRRMRRFPPGKPISTGSWAAFNRMAQPSFSLLQSASDSGNSENLIFLLFDLPPARWRNRRREPARRAEGAAPYTLVGCAALAKATHANSSRTRVFGQVPGLVKFVRLGGQAAFAVA